MAKADHSSGSVAGELRPSIRSDLRIAQEHPTTTENTIRVKDPDSGRDFAFEGDEGVLFLAAKGGATLPDMQAQLASQTGRDVDLDTIAAFFRKLAALGLLESIPDTDLIASEPSEAEPGSKPEPPAAKTQAGVHYIRRETGQDFRAAGARARHRGPGEARESRSARDLLERRRQEQAEKTKASAVKQDTSEQPDIADKIALLTDVARIRPMKPASEASAAGRRNEVPRAKPERPTDGPASATGEAREPAGDGTDTDRGDQDRDVAKTMASESPDGEIPDLRSPVVRADRDQDKAAQLTPPESAGPAAPGSKADAPAPANDAARPGDTVGTEQHGTEPAGGDLAADASPPAEIDAPEDTEAGGDGPPSLQPPADKAGSETADASLTEPAPTAASKASADRPDADAEKKHTPRNRFARRNQVKSLAAIRPAAGHVKRGSADGSSANLIAKRLRERADRGTAPKTGQPADDTVSESTRATPGPVPLPAPGRPEPELDPFDFDDGFDEPFGAGLGAGMRGGPGGGMMGGGMRPGMMGARRLAARRGRAGAEAGSKSPVLLTLFDPQPVFRLLYVLGYPLKYLLWIILPMVVIAGFTVFKNSAELREAMAATVSDLGNVTVLVLSLFAVNLVSRLAQGTAIVAQGGRVRKLGFTLMLGLIPRFVIDRSGIRQLDRRGQLWAYGSSMLSRLAIFATGTIFWAANSDQGGQLALLALLASQTALTVFVITAFPLIPADGQRFMSVLFNEPKLLPKSIMALKYVFRGGSLPQQLSRQDVVPLMLFGLGMVLTFVLILGLVLITAAIWLERELGGVGVILFFVGIASCSIWLGATLGRLRRDRSGFDPAQFAAAESEALPAAAPAARTRRGARAGIADEPDPALSGKAKVLWALILVALISVAFVPYRYDAGGRVEILPAARGQAIARTDGSVVEILVSEGSPVQRGDVLARLSSWDQESAVGVAEARLEGARASLARLLAGSKPEEIELARKQVEAAEKDIAFYEAEAERARQLVQSGAMAASAAERAESNLNSRLADLEVARANLSLVESPATPEEIAIAEADVARLERELAYARDELERTRIVAPVDGRVVTRKLNLLIGSFLDSGDVLLEIEETGTVDAVISVPEADISLISPGDTVRLKAWGHSEDEILGTVETIAPTAEDQGYGSVVRVTTRFENEDDFLRTGMTGYAKIDGRDMRVWEAYLRSIRRFVQIEVWSWIP